MKKQLIILIIVLSSSNYIIAQNVNLEQVLTGKPFNLAGAVSANTVYYNSNQTGGRLPFTYFVQGALTVSSYQFAMPISYSYSNQGDNFNYQIPFKFNRLSLHPKYKWIQGHIGDVSMNFSSYTLSGHQFTGAGLELSPKGGFKLSTMYGRLLKATEDNGDPRTIPAFERNGYGAKLSYEKQKYKLGIIGFYAKDKLNSIDVIPEEKGVTPKENLVLSFEGMYKITQNLSFKAAYASSALTQDLRATSIDTSTGIAGSIFNNTSSTEYYNALKTSFDYTFSKSSIGLAYERIDPGYETLGAYFFNNDFENITVNATTTLFKDKVNLSFNIGYQRDDLNKQKETATSRTVGAVNANIKASEKLQITGSYSNFSTFTNLKPNQFDIINDDNLLDNERDTYDYKQLSQNANINLNYTLTKREDLNQNINFNYALADVSNEQGGIVRLGDASTFHNINAAYILAYPKSTLTISPAINATYNTIGREDALTWGPTLMISKKFFEKALSISFASSYNKTTNQNSSKSVVNFRANARYTYNKKHNFNLSAVQLFKSGNNSIQSLTITFGYNYSFNLVKIKKKKKQKSKIHKEKQVQAKTKEDKVSISKDKTDKKIKINFKEFHFADSISKVKKAVLKIDMEDRFKEIKNIKSVSKNINQFKDALNKQQNKKEFKKEVIKYLEYLERVNKNKKAYNRLVLKSLNKLYNEADKLTYSLQENFKSLVGNINKKENKTEEDTNLIITKEKQLKAHLWMISQLENTTITDVKNDKGLLKDFKDENIENIFRMINEKQNEEQLLNNIESKLIKFYHNKALMIKQ